MITNLQRARTEQVNKESAARLAKQNADQAVVDAETSQQTAVSALTEAQQTFRTQQAELDKLTAERAAAQAKLDEARNWSAPAGGQPAAQPVAAPSTNPAADWDRAPEGVDPATGNWATPWDPFLPAIPSAFVSGDPIAIINTILGIRVDLGAGNRRIWAATSCRSSACCPLPPATPTARFRASTAARPPST